MLDKATVRDIMTIRLAALSPQASLAKAAGLMCRNKIGCLPVLCGGRRVEIVAESDIFRVVADEVREMV